MTEHNGLKYTHAQAHTNTDSCTRSTREQEGDKELSKAERGGKGKRRRRKKWMKSGGRLAEKLVECNRYGKVKTPET